MKSSQSGTVLVGLGCGAVMERVECLADEGGDIRFGGCESGAEPREGPDEIVENEHLSVAGGAGTDPDGWDG